MKSYSFWDIPSVMLASVEAVVSKRKESVVRLVNADSIKNKIGKVLQGSKVVVVFVTV